MSDAKESMDGGGTTSEAAVKAGVGLVPLVLIVFCTVLIVLGAAGGGIYWFIRSGRLTMPAMAAPVSPAAVKVDPVKTKVVLLEPLLVNLSENGGGGYLRVVMALEVEDPPPLKDAKPKEEKPAEKGSARVNELDVRLRDAALTVLGRETSQALLEPDGKELLKKQLKAAISEHLPEVKVVDVMFTEFLVQR